MSESNQQAEPLRDYYGRGLTNINLDTGIRYGVLHSNTITEAFDNIVYRGVDVDFEDFQAEVSQRLKHDLREQIELWQVQYCQEPEGLLEDLEALQEMLTAAFKKTVKEYRLSGNRSADMADDVLSDLEVTELRPEQLPAAIEARVKSLIDNMEWDGYEGTGDCTRYRYEEDGYRIMVHSDGDMFIMLSPYYTRAQFCSPCAPGAGYLLSPNPSGPKFYCLHHDWFDEGVAPYPVYDVETNEQVAVRYVFRECECCCGSGWDSLQRVLDVRLLHLDEMPEDLVAFREQLRQELRTSRGLDYRDEDDKFKCGYCRGSGRRRDLLEYRRSPGDPLYGEVQDPADDRSGEGSDADA